MPTAAGHGVAFVTELGDPCDAGRFSGLFAAHWESDDGQRWKDGPVDVPVGEAIEWARQRSETVLVMLGGGADGEFTAGRRVVADRGVKPWPQDLQIAARPEGSALDGSEQVVPWLVQAKADISAADERSVERRIAAAADVVAVHVRSTARHQIELTLMASGARPAMAVAWRLINAALDGLPNAVKGEALLEISDVRRPHR